MSEKEKTYVSGDLEVRKTGRFATKALPGGKTLRLVEITPVSEYDGTWKKFVQENSLFEIQEEAK
jgi:hypothetical protein